MSTYKFPGADSVYIFQKAQRVPTLPVEWLDTETYSPSTTWGEGARQHDIEKIDVNKLFFCSHFSIFYCSPAITFTISAKSRLVVAETGARCISFQMGWYPVWCGGVTSKRELCPGENRFHLFANTTHSYSSTMSFMWSGDSWWQRGTVYIGEKMKNWLPVLIDGDDASLAEKYYSHSIYYFVA